MGKFIKILDENYKFWQSMEYPPESKLEYIGSTIFDFTTYDGRIDKLLAEKMILVLKCIIDRKQSEYQENEYQYINYLTMVNMPFLANKLEWGGSIRGAWFDEFNEYEVDCGRIKIEKQELALFIKDLLEWCETKTNIL